MPLGPEKAKLRDDRSKLTEQVRGMPAPIAWGSFIQKILHLVGVLRVSLPCAGTDSGEGFQHMGINWRACDVWDVVGNYAEAMKHFFRKHGGGEPNLHVGLPDGDVTSWVDNLCHLTQCHFLMGGPPCPPWSSQGRRQGLNDDRARVFEAVLQIIIYLIHERGLLAVCLENVKGVLQSINGCQPFFIKLIGVLRECVPCFCWDISRLEAENYQSGQQRVRVLLRGLHRKLCPEGCVPAVLGPFGRAPLGRFLNRELPHFPVENLNKNMQSNRTAYLKLLWSNVERGLLDPWSITIFGLDRAKGMVFKQLWYADISPTLTTSNVYLWVLVLAEEHLPDHERTFSRFLSAPERLALQGKSPELALHLGSEPRLLNLVYIYIYICIYMYRRLGGVNSPLGRPPRNREIVSCRACVRMYMCVL